MRWGLLEQVLNPRVTFADLVRAVRNVYRHDPEKAESVVGQVCGLAFKRAEKDYEARGCRGRQRWG